jgi:hypothetical protein
MTPDSAKSSDQNDAKPAAVKAPADEAVRPVTAEGANTVKPAADPATTAALSKRARARLAGSPDCTRFRTYNAASRSYRDFSGQRRSCP